MFPLLLVLGPIKIYTSLLFTFLAFLVGGYLYWRKGREEHYPEHELFDSYLLSLVWGVLFSRFGFVVLHIGELGFRPLHWIDIVNYPGFMPFLGVIAMMWSTYRFAGREKWDQFEVLDFTSLALAGMMTIFWLSNFFSGAELGTPTNLPWGVVFPNVFDKRHPVQLYGALAYFFVFLYMFWVESRYRTFEWYRAKKDSAQSGFLHAVFCMALGVFGGLLWLGSASKVFVFGVPVEPLLRAVIFFYGAITLFQRSGRSFSLRRK